MKAKFFFLGLCALALAACSIDEVSQVNDTNAVTFKATTITRADVTTTNNLASFSVWAWNTVDGYTNEFMDDVIATRNGTTSTFVTSPLYFWPTGSVDFYALTPATEITAVDGGVEYAYLGGEINEGDDVNPSWTYSGYVAKAQIENGNIVIDAVIPSKPEEQIDLCYGVAIEKSSGSVPMNFRHALSQIAFKAKSANEAFEVKIADVSVCSVYKEGVFTITDQDTSTHLDAGTSTSPAEDSQGTWVITETDEYDYAIKGRFLVDMTESVVEVPTNGDVVELVDPNGTLMLLPQTVVAWDPLTDYSDAELGGYIRILCHVEEAGSQLWPNNAAEEEESALEETGAFWTDEYGVEYAEIAVPLNDIEWEQGYRYTYTIIFGEGLGYYPPDDPNADLEGTPVLDIITFDVTVDEFQDAEATTDGQFDIPTDTDLSYIEVKTQDELLGAIHAGYQEIAIEESLTLEDAYLEFTQDCTLDLADGVVITPQNVSAKTDPANIDETQTATSAIHISGGTLTINAGEGAGIITVENAERSLDTSCFWLNGGNLIINGGTYKGGTWFDPNGGKYSGASATVYVELGYAYIYGGEFYGGWSGSMKQTSLLNCYDSNYRNGTANIYVYGGTYENFDPSNCSSEGAGTNFVVDGYWSVKSDYVDDNGFYTYTVLSTKVTSFNDLIDLLWAYASEITITEDMEITGELDFMSDCVLTIEPGVTISVPENNPISGTSSIIKVWYGANVDIYAEGATVATQGGAESVDISAIWVNNGTVNVYGGTYKGGVWTDPEGNGTATSSSACVYVEKGFVNIYDGTFLSGYSSNMKQTSILNCYATNYKADPRAADIVCYGGTYQNFDPSDCLSEGANTNFCATGYKTTSEADADGLLWYTVVEGN